MRTAKQGSIHGEIGGETPGAKIEPRELTVEARRKLSASEGATFIPAMAGSRKILIVDDEANVAGTMQLVFATRGYDVRAACSAEQAIEIISAWKPDLAILDVMLPNMNGIELGIAIEANYPECHVLLVSGHPGAGPLVELAREQGHPFDIFAKPIHPTVILDTVSSLLPTTNEPADA
jgi:DNA-binding NtrC family response regulator